MKNVYLQILVLHSASLVSSDCNTNEHKEFYKAPQRPDISNNLIIDH